MNTPTHDRDDHDDWNTPLKSLKPRAPRLDWDAIQAAHTAESTATTSLRQTSAAAPLRIRPAVAWWSGLAAGAAITFFAMQWLVLSDLRTKLNLLEKTAQRSTPDTTDIQPTRVSRPSGIVHAVDFHDLLDRSDLAVGSVRGNPNRLIHARASTSDSDRPSPYTNLPSASTSDDLPVRDDGEMAPESPSSNHWLLLRELKQAVY